MSYPTTKTAPSAQSATVTAVADGPYIVTLSNNDYNWANGALVVGLTKPNPSVLYKGIDVTSSFNNDISNVGWTVTLNRPGVNPTLVFSGGSSTSSSGPFTGGTVTGLPATPDAAESGWDAESGPVPELEPKP